MANNTRKPIIISGAGLASLLLAQALLEASIPFVVYERDTSMTFRAQGFRLRLSEEGLSAIESALGPEKFQRFWAKCGKTGGSGYTALDAITGEKLSGPADGGPPKPGAPAGGLSEQLGSRDGKIVGISRGDMRKLFMTGCESFIHWGHNVVSYELTGSGVRAIFADGSKSIEGDMLIGGEGIHSKIAKQVSNGKLKTYDTGARAINGQAPTGAYKALGEGVWRMVDATDPNKRFFVITNVRPGEMDDPSINFGWTMGAQPGVIEVPNNDYSVIGAPAASVARKLTANWHPRFKPLFDQMEEPEIGFWKISCSTPTGVPEWPNEPRVTVIGDAVHSMTPAGGLGANTAVRDSALLGRLLAEAGGYREGITAAYESKMRVYGSEAVAESYRIATTQFSVNITEKSPEIS